MPNNCKHLACRARRSSTVHEIKQLSLSLCGWFKVGFSRAAVWIVTRAVSVGGRVVGVCGGWVWRREAGVGVGGFCRDRVNIQSGR